MFYNDIIDERAKNSHLTKNTIKIAKGYFEYMNDNRHMMDMDSFLDYIDLIKPRYSDALRARSLVCGIMVKDFHDLKANWYGRDENNELLRMCDLEKEAKQFMTYDEWKQYEEEMDELFIEQKLYYISLAHYCLVYAFTWHGVERNDLKKMDFENDIEVRDDDTIIALIESKNKYVEFNNKALAWILRNEARDEKFIKQIKGYGKANARVLNEKYASRKPFNMTLHALYTSGVMYRVSKGEEYIDIGQEQMVEYYHKIIEILYKK